ncbi:PEP-CTERM sorting domain-containing protein [Halomicronema sp. CCY15110]|uniref:PEP-CTERM sorting domain-containing protein n=1 Tax=Halomicronema sp. CCY15110 TaxID=2767773 RepID=UPI00195182BD|nr:PEP-CTERM sorting domain-containing protein [Halomicronema sp. CCY15110]
MKTFAKLSGLLCTTVAICSVASTAAADNLVTNGGFENPNLAPGTWSWFDEDTDVEGWKLLNEDSTIEIRNNVSGTAYEGNQFAEIDSHRYTAKAGESMGFFQDIMTTVGKKYKLSFAFGPRNNVNGDNLFKVTFGDMWKEMDAGNSNGGWQLFSDTITATSDTTRLQFELMGKYDTLGANIDDVHVTAVPEPFSLLGLAAIGTVGAAGIARKRQAAQG